MPAAPYRPRLVVSVLEFKGITENGPECEAFLGAQFVGYYQEQNMIIFMNKWNTPQGLDVGGRLMRYPDDSVEALLEGDFVVQFEPVPPA